jgi:hypothetical protein
MPPLSEREKQRRRAYNRAIIALAAEHELYYRIILWVLEQAERADLPANASTDEQRKAWNRAQKRAYTAVRQAHPTRHRELARAELAKERPE